MGSCCSCLKSTSADSEPETELTEQKPTYAFSVSRAMSSPTAIIDGLDLSGEGLALVDVSIEQDAAYWEWHVKCDDGQINHDGGDGDDFFDEGAALKFGVATKKDRDFYMALESNEDGDDGNIDDGTKLMRAIPSVQDGDTIGIAVQQSDLPMVQFLFNGEPLHELAISRFRGMVFPSVCLKKGYSVQFVWDEDEFKELSPHVRFGPLIPERGLI